MGIILYILYSLKFGRNFDVYRRRNNNRVRASARGELAIAVRIYRYPCVCGTTEHEPGRKLYETVRARMHIYTRVGIIY